MSSACAVYITPSCSLKGSVKRRKKMIAKAAFLVATIGFLNSLEGVHGSPTNTHKAVLIHGMYAGIAIWRCVKVDCIGGLHCGTVQHY